MRRHRFAVAMGALWVVTVVVGFIHAWRNERRLDELQSQVAALQAVEDHDTHVLADLRCCDFFRDDSEARAELERQIEEARRKADDLRLERPEKLPQCRCTGTGDPLCAEIPGQTCAP